LDGFGVVFLAQEIRQAAEEVGGGDGGLVQVKEALKKRGDCSDTANDDHPHEGAAFLNKV
jgi:hypothetical protein